jgi:methyl-coenzyme M reductase subunit D
MDMEIFPHRLLGADTTEKLLNNLNDVQISRLFVDKDSLQQMPSILTKEKSMSEGENIDLLVKTDEFF